MLVTNECPRRTAPDDMHMWLGICTHYRAGHLWQRGGISDQPHVYLEVMKTIETWAEKLRPKA